MSMQLTADDFKQSLNAHVAARGEDLRAKFGPNLGWNDLQSILEDRTFCRYPCEVRFDAGPLLAGEFAHPVARTAVPEDGFTLFVHPCFSTNLERVPYLVLYQLVTVNYGEFASAEDAETFGAHALGLARDDYYAILCEMADQVSGGTGCSQPTCACNT